MRVWEAQRQIAAISSPSYAKTKPDCQRIKFNNYNDLIKAQPKNLF